MSEPFFFIDPEDAGEDKISVSGEDFKHLVQVLRGKPGDRIIASDNKEYKYTAFIEEIRDGTAVLAVQSREAIRRRIPEITLFQCILKKNAMEMVIQKATEIGVGSIVPIISERIVPAGFKKTGSKVIRWQKISDQASKQSKRDFKCMVSGPLKLSEIKVSDYGSFLVPYVKKDEANCASSSLEGLKQSSSIGCIIGPEGGFEESEVEWLESKGATVLKFGNNILRSETAAIYLLSIMDYLIREK